ncbi:MAG: hypothetical protein BECKG1743F_GA0114225_105952 [Candidatus Kentron sp. G]|nr:MAG: hypothetical protein BECKG1743E_GA0114224_103226 [Candidatus Kentron sp. G]VFN01582.1 MAG: hypothetical protein BECKG1743F_GA0114225_105952 [Candidatus Kentron sp. G]
MHRRIDAVRIITAMGLSAALNSTNPVFGYFKPRLRQVNYLTALNHFVVLVRPEQPATTMTLPWQMNLNTVRIFYAAPASFLCDLPRATE